MMSSKKNVLAFAKKYLALFQSEETRNIEVEEGFAEECFALKFKMDCGEAFNAAFPGTKALSDPDDLKQIIAQVTDIQLLGSAIFSNWRYITHWDFCGILLSEENRAWFIIALGRLAILAADISE